jgi:hypothetical protein
MSPATLPPRTAGCASKEDFVDAAKTNSADARNNLRVDAGRVGDLGKALDIAPRSAPVAAETLSRPRTAKGKGRTVKLVRLLRSR